MTGAVTEGKIYGIITVSYEYDALSRLTKETSAIGSVNRYAYNAAGLLERETNARKQDTEYTYDALGRITRIKDEAGTIGYEYDAGGNVLAVTEEKTGADGQKVTETIRRTFDAGNRVTACTDSNGKTIRYGYDELGNRVSLTYPGGGVVRYAYYASGRMKSVTDSRGRVTYYAYDSEGNLTATERPDGTRETNVYNAAGQVVARTDVRVADGAVINEYHYEYDARGNIIKVTGTGIDGITEASGAVSVSGDGSVSVAEGADGVKPENGTTAGTGTTTHASQAQAAAFSMPGAEMEYDADNRLVKYNGMEVKYDADGNMTYGPVNGEMTELVYDCRNRLIKAGSVTYEYDAENTRTAVNTDTSRTEYVTDVAGELSQVLEAHTTYTDETAEDRIITYVYGNGLLYEYEKNAVDNGEKKTNIDNTNEDDTERNSLETNNQEGSGLEQGESITGEPEDKITDNTADTTEPEPILVHHYNNIGSTTKLTNELGEVVEEYCYGAYGELLSGDAGKSVYLYNDVAGTDHCP